MLSSSAILALWILTANPQTPSNDGPSLEPIAAPVQRTTFQFRPETRGGDDEVAAETRKQLPPDPAYDGPETRA